MRVAAAGGVLLLLLACAPRGAVSPVRTSSAPTGGTAPRGGLIPAHAGTPLVFCRTPGLLVNVKVDSVATGATRFAAGTAELASGAANAAAHASNDEAIYFLSAGGRAFVGADTIDIHSGLMMYVPQGVRHGFVSAPDSPVRFVWMIAPQDLARGFRARGVPPGSACPAPGQ